MGKFFKWIIVLGLVGAVGWVSFKWYRARGISEDAFNLVPPDAIFCIATDDPIASWKEIGNSKTWSHLQKNGYIATITAAANSLDSLIRKNDLLFELIGNRALMVSAHMTGLKTYDFLFLVDLKEVSGIKFLNEYLTDFKTYGFIVRKEKHGQDDLIILYNPSDKSNLYLSLPGTYLLASYSKRNITSALDYRNRSSDLDQGAKEIFVRPTDDLETSGVMRLYVNYAKLPQFMRSYSEGSNEYINHLSKALLTTSLSLHLEDELIRAVGYTHVNDSVESYLNTLAISGRGATEIMEITPQRTAFYLGFGFSSFKEFFKNFEKNLQHNVTEYNNYRANLKQVEDYLNISLQENFINWIGDEVALIELQSSGKGLNNEAAIVLKADNIEKARKDLAYIEKMVRRKTPVKFKAVEYHGYSINYLSMKGLFKILLGKFFARYDKPYYTIINNFVVFSNHPQTLESIIDDYLSKKTLIKSEAFRTFRKEFEDEGSVFVYINTPVLFNTIKTLVDIPTQTSMEKNKEYITCFRQIGFQLVPQKNRFKTILAEQFVDPVIEPSSRIVQRTESDSSNINNNEVIEDDSDIDPMTLPYIYVQNLSASTYTSYFSDSTVHVKVDLKHGFKDGSFTEYYPNGEVKMKGSFKQDKRDGVWRLYDENGKLITKRNYKDDEVKKERVKD